MAYSFSFGFGLIPAGSAGWRFLPLFSGYFLFFSFQKAPEYAILSYPIDAKERGFMHISELPREQFEGFQIVFS